MQITQLVTTYKNPTTQSVDEALNALFQAAYDLIYAAQISEDREALKIGSTVAMLLNERTR